MAGPRDNSSTIGMSTLSTFLSPLTVWIRCRSPGTLLAGAVLAKWPPPRSESQSSSPSSAAQHGQEPHGALWSPAPAPATPTALLAGWRGPQAGFSWGQDPASLLLALLVGCLPNPACELVIHGTGRNEVRAELGIWMAD